MSESTTNKHTDLYKKHRPTRFKDLVGQPQVVAQMEEWLANKRVPNAVLLTGASGCGKTTAARILANKLGCTSRSDCQEINVAESRGIDMIRDVMERMTLSPMSGSGGRRVWIMDEVARMTSDAQSAALKMLEDGPRHAFFFLCTTDPQKLLRTIITRCTELKFRALTESELAEVLDDVVTKEAAKVGAAVVQKIAEMADGSARKALVLLHQVMGLPAEEQLDAVQRSDSKRQAIELARALMDPRTQWSKVVELLKSLDEPPESLRHMILGYYQSVMLSGGVKANRAAELIAKFQFNTFDSGKPGLALMCYESLRGGK